MSKSETKRLEIQKPRVWKNVKLIRHDWSEAGHGETSFFPDKLGSCVSKEDYDALAAELVATQEINVRLNEALRSVQQDKDELRCQINAQKETIRAAGELVERLQAEGYDRWREKYYDKITELNKAEADLALAVEALKYIAGCESKKCQDSGCMCVYQSAHQVLAKLGKGD